MSQLVVLAFDDMTGADQFKTKMESLQKQELVGLADLVVVVRNPDGKTKIKQSTSLAGIGALNGAFWGMLIGLLFWAPWLGLAAGALGGALGGKFSDIGIDDDFIKQVSDEVQPGNSAIFLLIDKITPERVEAEVDNMGAKVLRTNLDPEREKELRAHFGSYDEDVAADAGGDAGAS
jgi:uncharacterized membrane protein